MPWVTRRLESDDVTALGAATSDDAATALGAAANQEAVGASTLDLGGLIGTFGGHDFSSTGKYVNAAGSMSSGRCRRQRN